MKGRLKNTVAVAPKLKLKLRLVTVFSLAIAVLVSIRVFTLLSIGTVETAKAAKKEDDKALMTKIKIINNINSSDSFKNEKKDLETIK